MVITLYIHVHHWWLYININLSHHIWLLFYPHLCWFYHDLFPWFIHLLKDFVARTDSGKSPSKQFAWATGRWTAARAAAAASSTLEPPGRVVDVAWYGGPMHLSWGFSTLITINNYVSLMIFKLHEGDSTTKWVIFMGKLWMTSKSVHSEANVMWGG